MALGKKTGGRKKGSPDKRTHILKRFTQTTGVLSEERVRQILTGAMPCGACMGAGKTKFQPPGPSPEPKIGKPPYDETCRNCWGSGMEILSPELIAKVAMEERQYVLPKLKSVEMTTKPGQGTHTVEELLTMLREA